MNTFRDIIKGKVEKLDIAEDCKSLLYQLISAELSFMDKYSKLSLDICKLTKPSDTRVWVEVSVFFNNDQLVALNMLQPFISNGCEIVISSAGNFFLRKTYYLYEIC